MQVQMSNHLCDTSTYLRVFDRLRELDQGKADQINVGRFPMTSAGFANLVGYLRSRYYVYDPCWKLVDDDNKMDLWQDFGVQVRRTPVPWDTK